MSRFLQTTKVALSPHAKASWMLKGEKGQSVLPSDPAPGSGPLWLRTTSELWASSWSSVMFPFTFWKVFFLSQAEGSNQQWYSISHKRKHRCHGVIHKGLMTQKAEILGSFPFLLELLSCCFGSSSRKEKNPVWSSQCCSPIGPINKNVLSLGRRFLRNSCKY